MKAIFKLTIILFLSVFSSSALRSENTDSLSVILSQNSIKSEIAEYENGGRRTPPRPVECTISKATGVNIQNIASEDILLFEIYDESGICLGAFSDPESFTAFFFSRPGLSEVRFHTSQHVFRGYTSL